MNKQISSKWLWLLLILVIGGTASLIQSDPTSNVTPKSQTDTQPVIQQDDEKVIKEEEQDDSAPAQAQQTDDQSTSPASSETIGQRNALRSAKAYLNYSAFSRDGLVEQLEYEKFSHADAVYGADNSGADWYEQAAKSAEQYMEYSAFSRGSLIEQLKYDGFTQVQAEYGADAVGF